MGLVSAHICHVAHIFKTDLMKATQRGVTKDYLSRGVIGWSWFGCNAGISYVIFLHSHISPISKYSEGLPDYLRRGVVGWGWFGGVLVTSIFKLLTIYVPRCPHFQDQFMKL